MRLLLVRLSAIGDVIHTLPALEVLRAALPDAELTWVVEPAAAPLLRGHPALDQVVVLERPRRLVALRRAGRRLRALRARRFDAALDLQGLLRSAVVARASGARRVLGPAWAREGATLLYTDRLDLPRPRDAHAVLRHVAHVRAALAALGLPAPPPGDDVPAPRLGCRADAPCSTPARPLPSRFVALLPGAGKPANRPPARLLAAVADLLAPEVAVALVGSKADRPRARAVIERCRVARPLDLTGACDLAGAAALLARAALVIGGDTGPLHLARALGRPVVGLFAPADPARTGPAGLPGAAPVEVLRGSAPCAPCLAARCRRLDGARVCFAPLDAEAIARAARSALAR